MLSAFARNTKKEQLAGPETLTTARDVARDLALLRAVARNTKKEQRAETKILSYSARCS